MAVEQACDVCPVFRLFKAIAKTVTKDNLPSFGLPGKLSKYFFSWKHDGRLCLKPTKETVLKEFLACFPSIASRVAPTEAIASGFLDNVMIDYQSYCYLDFQRIMQTCKTAITTL